MDGYLKVISQKERLNKEVREVDEKIDDEVFKLYGLTNEEVALVKKASGIY